MSTRNWSVDVSSREHEQQRLNSMRHQLRNDMCIAWSKKELPAANRRLEAEAQLVSAYTLLTSAQTEISGEEYAGEPATWAFEQMEELKDKLWATFQKAAENEELALHSAAPLSAAAYAFVNASQMHGQLDDRNKQIKDLNLSLRHDDITKPQRRYGHGIRTI